MFLRECFASKVLANIGLQMGIDPLNRAQFVLIQSDKKKANLGNLEIHWLIIL